MDRCRAGGPDRASQRIRTRTLRTLSTCSANHARLPFLRCLTRRTTPTTGSEDVVGRRKRETVHARTLVFGFVRARTRAATRAAIGRPSAADLLDRSPCGLMERSSSNCGTTRALGRKKRCRVRPTVHSDLGHAPSGPSSRVLLRMWSDLHHGRRSACPHFAGPSTRTARTSNRRNE
jgi:hypothetical protein